MAATEASNENSLIFPLYVGDTAINVVLEERDLSWNKDNQTKLPSRTSSPKKTSTKTISSKSVAWRYILCARVGETKPTLEIFFIEKKPKNIWIKTSQKFEGIEVNCRECAQAITQKLESLVNRPQNLLVFVNPVSGTAKNGVKILKTQVEPLLELANIKHDAIVTEYAGHIKKHIQEHDLSQYDGITVVGGDGTYTEAFTGLLLTEAARAGLDINDVNVLWRKPRIRIGIVPAGTGQGMVKSATGGNDVTTAILHIIVGSSFETPCLTVHNGPKLVATGSMLAAYGLFGDAIRDSEAKRGLGIARYPYGILKTLVNHRSLHLDVRYHPYKANQDPPTIAQQDSSTQKQPVQDNSKRIPDTIHSGSADSANNAQETDKISAENEDNAAKNLDIVEQTDTANSDNCERTHGEHSDGCERTHGEHSDGCERTHGEHSDNCERTHGEHSDNCERTRGEHFENGGGDAAQNCDKSSGVIASVQGAMETVDITADSTNESDGWVSQSGVYRAIHIFMINIIAARQATNCDVFAAGGLFMTLVKGAAGRLKHMGIILRAFDMISNRGTSEDIAEIVEPDMVEFTLQQHTEQSLQQLAQTDKREVINVDGDPFVLLHPTVYIRKQANVMQMFGEQSTEPWRW